MDSFNKKLNNSLKSLGFLFPENEKQLESFLKEIEDITVPENIKNATDEFIFERKRPTKTISFNKDNLSVNNLAQAARKGENIPESILRKMKKDRDNKENDSGK